MKSFKSVWEDNKLKKEIHGVKFEIKNNSLYIDNDIVEFKSYLILEILDAGANAIILKSKEEISNRICAIKVWFSKNKKTGELNIEKHKKEIEKIANFDSDLIVKYYSTDIVNNYAYCTMEYIEGDTLRNYLNYNHPTLNERYRIMNSIIKALGIAHRKNIYHGDLHDRNVLISKSGEIKVLDFGTSIGKKDYSMSRDSHLMYILGKSIMGENKYKKLVWMNNKSARDLCPRTMRLILESMSKIIVLLDFLNHGVTKGVIDDLAFFATLVPFFNLTYLASVISENSTDKEREENLNYFFKRLNYEISKRIEVYNLCNPEDIVGLTLPEVYTKVHESFVKTTSTHLEEKYIYHEEYEVEVFKSSLYFDGITVRDTDTHLDIIDKALKKYSI